MLFIETLQTNAYFAAITCFISFYICITFCLIYQLPLTKIITIVVDFFRTQPTPPPAFQQSRVLISLFVTFISIFFVNYLVCKHFQNELLSIMFYLLCIGDCVKYICYFTLRFDFALESIHYICWCFCQLKILYLPYKSNHIMSGAKL